MQNPVLFPKSYFGNTPWTLYGSCKAEDPLDRANRPSAFDTNEKGLSILRPASLLRRESECRARIGALGANPPSLTLLRRDAGLQHGKRGGAQ